MTNSGKEYEALTERVFRRLVSQDGLCVDVQRDIRLPGKSGAKHQIDVSFRFKVGPVEYLTIVQCKDWANPVKQEQVLAFRSVLDDIPGQPRGIMVCRSGYQEGARTLANHHGIKLYQLREQEDEDWEGLIQTVHITSRILIPQFRHNRFEIDEAWVKEQMVLFKLPTLELKLTAIPGLDRAEYESGETCDLGLLLNDQVPHEPCDWTAVRKVLPDAILVETRDCPLPKLRVTAVEAEVQVRELVQEIVVSIDHLVAYCFRDILTGKQKFLDKVGHPISDHAKELPA